MIGALQVRPRAFAAGVASFLPVVNRFTNRGSGGTESARYCYSVWLRHLVRASESGLPTDPGCVAELGPGDSLGIGLAAVLSGADRYIALDVKAHASPERNLRVFDELVRLFQACTPVPADDEWPLVQPKLSTYSFPTHILPSERLKACLSEARLADIRNAIRGEQSEIRVSYRAPWSDPSILEPACVDLLFSQAVLEHVEDLETTYSAMRRWMKPGASMSHSVDFCSHGLTRDWNGHWSLGDVTWSVVRGSRRYLINRQPLSIHLDLLERNGFDLITVDRRREAAHPAFKPAKRFRSLSADDASTRGAFIQARVPSGVR
jgi:hypothetical protein